MMVGNKPVSTDIELTTVHKDYIYNIWKPTDVNTTRSREADTWAIDQLLTKAADNSLKRETKDDDFRSVWQP